MPVGLYFLATRTYIGSGNGRQAIEISTSYEVLAVTWPGLLLLSLIYVRGFRWFFVAPFFSYIGLMALQGQDRYRVLLPVILFLMIWLDSRRKKWPSLRVICALVAIVPVFLAMDALGMAYRTGTLSWSQASDVIAAKMSDAVGGETNDQYGLDALGVALAQSDRHGSALWGTHYLNIVYLPIPRPFLAGKPVLNEDVVELSTADRPLSTIGAVFTLPGSMWVDFRWLGLTVGAFLFGRVTLWAFCRSYANGFGTLSHFLYLVVASSSIQIFRDGPTSLVTFVLVKNFPLVLIVLLSFALRPRQGQAPGPVKRHT
jgi:hypothetical protein